MSSPRTHMLCLTFAPGSVDLAEVRRGAAGVQVIRQSTLILPQGIGLDQAAAMGAALAEHLRQNGYDERRCVIGLCARWLLSRHKLVPPADKEAMRGIVNLQIEREYGSSAVEMTFDYLLKDAGGPDTQKSLLLVGVRASVLRQAEQVAAAAGLKVDAITATPLAAASEHTGTIVVLENGVAGVIQVRDGCVLGLVSCAADPDGLEDAAVRQALIAELSRCVLQLPAIEGASRMTLLLPGSVSETAAKELAADASHFGAVEVVRSDPALQCARHTMKPGGAIIDFLASRLAPPKRQRLSPAMQWGIRAAVVAVLIIGVVVYLWLDATARRDVLRAEYEAIKDKAASLDKVLNETDLAADWYDKRPPALDCLLELTRTFPTRGAIRVETLTLRGDLSGQIDCAAENSETIDRYFSSMQRSAKLLEVNLGSVRQVGGNSTWINFPIAFRFDPAGQGVRP